MIDRSVWHRLQGGHRVFLISAACLVFFAWFAAPAPGDGDSDALLRFKASLSNATALNDWDASAAPCSGNDSHWRGVLCRNGAAFGLRLERMGLSGAIDLQPLGALPTLRILSLMFNGLEGPMPRGVNKLRSLRGLYLAYNRFSGEISEGVFAGMNFLNKVHLGENRLSGEIPTSLARLPKLIELSLEGNLFTGKIPEFRRKGLLMVNVANNSLGGQIPAGLSNMTSTFFIGNRDLCGKPLGPCRPSRGLTPSTIGLLAVTAVAAAFLLAVFVAVCCVRRSQLKKSSSKSSQDSKIYKKLACDAVQREAPSPPPPPAVNQRAEQRKLHFVRNDREKFSLQELLRASAEVLGSGGFGSSYKAVLSSGHAMVVKRFKHISSVGKEEFYDHMKKNGRLSHPNLLPLIAFYYRREEKLLVSDFVPNGSLANLLHANRMPGQTGVDWSIRLKIIKGVARGLAYLYRVFPDLNLPHGNLKSSNVLLDHNDEPLLTDYALILMVDKEQSQQFMVAYKSPEFMQQNRTSRKTDVWSLGILILEILTGKFPANYLRQGKGANDDLAAWVESVARAEWTAELFDKDMRAGKDYEGEMLKLLKIGLRCCEWDMERRIEMREAVERIEGLSNDGDSDGHSDDHSSSHNTSSYVTACEGGDFSSSKAMAEELFLI